MKPNTGSSLAVTDGKASPKNNVRTSRNFHMTKKQKEEAEKLAKKKKEEDANLLSTDPDKRKFLPKFINSCVQMTQSNRVAT